ncbi:MAG: 2-oxoglutarate dehydrogenase E1 component [Flavobacteriales bacterium]|nr:2-oxoglutarate dehydrogenase E1 component [Flavobacteriales bacterium]MCX7767421.1 2-oxoglutarate dehydrogenase E1 component [Flavobacteriales bacterium]
MDKFTFLGNADPAVVEDLYEKFLKGDQAVDPQWRHFFEGFEFARTHFPELPEDGKKEATDGQYLYPDEFKVINLINAYRARGHLFTKTNPVRTRRKWGPPLNIEYFGLTEADLDRPFEAGVEIGLGRAPLRQIVEALEQIYCKSVGYEFLYMRSPDQIDFIKSRIDPLRGQWNFSREKKLEILDQLTRAVVFEKFLGKKFVGQKRFSLEGGESLIPALKALVKTGTGLGVRAFFIGMAHRGRLNVLHNIMGKPAVDIFVEFEGREYEDTRYDGDVKYHLGYNAVVQVDGVDVEMHLLPNPSHLESVGPLVAGLARTMADHRFGSDLNAICPILIHGDAAIAGQGVVYELVQMQHLDAYKVGGTVHIVINNQVGFTTNYTEARSSIYCTDVGKVTLSPVFHVNGDDPEAVVHAVELAMEFRQKFHKDVFIDLLCYRKYGHNEGDEPRFTQPILYKIIDSHPDPRTIYLKKLAEEGIDVQAEAEAQEKIFVEQLEAALEQARGVQKTRLRPFLHSIWQRFRTAEEADFEESPFTGYDLDKLNRLAIQINTLPEDMHFLRKIKRIFEDRIQAWGQGKADWAMGELLAYATLLTEGYTVRLVGQDTVRGTFSHRHAIVKTEDSEAEYCPLHHLPDARAPFYIYNSHLSEYAAMGFEYGYALGTPEGLTLWEAQFGDFSNGAQIVIDQYISAAEDKWQSQNGLVLLLPHGYEGMGAEHSSARLERFLLLCAELNIQVVVPTTPANMFHVLRRQIHRPFRKPLVALTPKSLLRHPLCLSTPQDLAEGRFMEVIGDDFVSTGQTTRVIFCSGKVYYDLLEEREKRQAMNTALVRIEQLYPFPLEQVVDIRDAFPQATDWLWVQEEPYNMGARFYIMEQFRHPALRDVPLRCVSRPASASPATGSPERSEIERQQILRQAFEPLSNLEY